MSTEPSDAAAVRVPPPLVFASAILLGLLADRFFLPLPLPVARGIRLGLTAVLAVPAVVLFGSAVGWFLRTGQDPKPWKPSPEMIRSGAYRWTRNPMYVAMALAQAAIGVGASSGWTLTLVPVALAIVYRTAVRHEEAYLARKFGPAYLDYKRSVRRWL